MFDATRYLRDKRIAFTSGGPKSSMGWINLYCPVCQSHKEHLGFNTEKGYFHCWRCGSHPTEEIIMLLEQIPYHEACKIVTEYETDFEYRPLPSQKKKSTETKIEWPPGTIPLQPHHKAYLRNRGFDPDKLEDKYKLMGTVNAGQYSGRIMIPIFFNGEWVSYQGRDITGLAKEKYKACMKQKEIHPHDEILYNIDNVSESVIIVEGVFDVWKLGDIAVATFGTSVEPPQIRLAVERFKKVFIMFDPEPEAQKKARWFRDQLAVMGIEANNILLKNGDPGDMNQNEVDKLKIQLKI